VRGQRVVLRWHLRQLMATRGLFQTSDLVPLLAARDIQMTRQAVHRLVVNTPLRINVDVLAALCDALDCQPNDLLEPVTEAVEQAPTGTDGAGEDNAAAGPGIGDLRPIRATIRRPYDGG